MSPGVPIEEISFPPAVTGRDMSVAAFLGISTGVLGRVTSLLEFEQNYDRGGPLWLAARAYFAEGGRTLWIAPVLEWTPVAIDDALAALGPIDEISTVAAPFAPAAMAAAKLAADAAARRDRIALLDADAASTQAALLAFRSMFDTSFAALYAPWVFSGTDLIPPSPFIAGVLSKTTPHKAPAGLALVSATALEREISKGEQDVLNPEGVNAIRSFPGRGILVWGGRTLSRNNEWKYVNVRRYFIYVERSVEKSIQWVVFEPNVANTWLRVLTAIQNFLTMEWHGGALQGVKSEEAFFVKCGLGQTMTQDDVDAGRLIVLIGVAMLKPAEFAILRVTALTATA